MSEIYTEALRKEMAAAFHRAMEEKGGAFTDFWRELTKPPIGPDVPVMYDEGDHTGILGYGNSPHATNVRVLIPEGAHRRATNHIINTFVERSGQAAAFRLRNEWIATYRIGE